MQSGAEPIDWKPIAAIGPGCREKKTQRTAKADLDVGKARYQAMRALIEEAKKR